MNFKPSVCKRPKVFLIDMEILRIYNESTVRWDEVRYDEEGT